MPMRVMLASDVELEFCLRGSLNDDEEQPRVPFGYAQGRHSTALRFAQDDSVFMVRISEAERQSVAACTQGL